jgi:hypothetical protein
MVYVVLVDDIRGASSNTKLLSVHTTSRKARKAVREHCKQHVEWMTNNESGIVSHQYKWTMKEFAPEMEDDDIFCYNRDDECKYVRHILFYESWVDYYFPCPPRGVMHVSDPTQYNPSQVTKQKSISHIKYRIYHVRLEDEVENDDDGNELSLILDESSDKDFQQMSKNFWDDGLDGELPKNNVK